MGHKVRAKKAYIPEIIKKAFDITDENVSTYDHCNSAEEIEIEMLAKFLQRGMSQEKAIYLAREASRDLWNDSEK